MSTMRKITSRIKRSLDAFAMEYTCGVTYELLVAIWKIRLKLFGHMFILFYKIVTTNYSKVTHSSIGLE